MHARPAHYHLSYQTVCFLFGILFWRWSSYLYSDLLELSMQNRLTLNSPEIYLPASVSKGGVDKRPGLPCPEQVFNFLSIKRQTVSMGKSNYLY